MCNVNEFLTGAGPDAPADQEENETARVSINYDDMFAQSLLESNDGEDDNAGSSGASSPESTGSAESSMSSHFGGMNYPSLFSSHSSGGQGTSQKSVREEPPLYAASHQRFESFENPLAGQSFGTQDDDSATSESPRFGKALYDFTAGGDDEHLCPKAFSIRNTFVQAQQTKVKIIGPNPFCFEYKLSLNAGEEIEIEYEVDGWFYVKKKQPGRDGKTTGLVPVLYVNAN